MEKLSCICNFPIASLRIRMEGCGLPRYPRRGAVWQYRGRFLSNCEFTNSNSDYRSGVVAIEFESGVLVKLPLVSSIRKQAQMAKLVLFWLAREPIYSKITPLCNYLPPTHFYHCYWQHSRNFPVPSRVTDQILHFHRNHERSNT